MPTTLTLDGFDLSTLGLYVDAPETDNWLDAPELSFDAAPTPTRPGGVVSRYGTTALRSLTIPLFVLPTTYGAANRELAEADLKRFHGRSVLAELDDGSVAKEITGVVTRIRIKPGRSTAPQQSTASITLLCADATWSAVEATTHTLNTTARRVVTFGTAPIADWTMTLFDSTGTLTNPVATIYSGAGVVLHTLTYTGAVTATQYLEVSAADGYVRLYSASAYTSVISAWTGGLPVLDPYDQPTIILSDGGGTAVGTLRYRMRYY